MQLDEIDRIFDELDGSSDRASAILITACLETDLSSCVCHWLQADEQLVQKLQSRDGPVSSFYSAIVLAEALQIIDAETAAALDRIRKIRNAFAHSQRSIDFKTPELLAECMSLKTRGMLKKLQEYGVPADDINGLSARELFLSCSHAIHNEVVHKQTKALERTSDRLKTQIAELERRMKSSGPEVYNAMFDRLEKPTD